jgi:hypothetical protein
VRGAKGGISDWLALKLNISTKHGDRWVSKIRTLFTPALRDIERAGCDGALDRPNMEAANDSFFLF